VTHFSSLKNVCFTSATQRISPFRSVLCREGIKWMFLNIFRDLARETDFKACERNRPGGSAGDCPNINKRSGGPIPATGRIIFLLQ
jgi:hypothetical protein